MLIIYSSSYLEAQRRSRFLIDRERKIIDLFSQGVSPEEILSQVKGTSFVEIDDILSKYMKVKIKDKPFTRSTFSLTQDPQFIQKVLAMYNSGKYRSLNQIAKELGISWNSVRRILLVNQNESIKDKVNLLMEKFWAKSKGRSFYNYMATLDDDRQKIQVINTLLDMTFKDPKDKEDVRSHLIDKLNLRDIFLELSRQSPGGSRMVQPSYTSHENLAPATQIGEPTGRSYNLVPRGLEDDPQFLRQRKPKTIITQELKNLVIKMFRGEPHLPISHMAKRLNLSPMTVKNILMREGINFANR